MLEILMKYNFSGVECTGFVYFRAKEKGRLSHGIFHSSSSSPPVKNIDAKSILHIKYSMNDAHLKTIRKSTDSTI